MTRWWIGVAAVGAMACARADERPRPAPPQPTTVKIKAHRGASFDAPENTLAAIERAWQLGADGVEIDVRLSKDGVPVLMHDEDTGRTGGVAVAVADQTLAELQALDVGAWKGAAFAGERVPTLAAVLDAVPGGRTLFVEIKTGADGVPAIAAVIRAHGAVTVAFESFDLPVLAAVARELPDAPRYWTIGVRKDRASGRALPHDPALAPSAAAEGIAGLAVDVRGVDARFAQAVAEAGLVLGVWTIDDPAVARAMADLGATWIETNRPDLVRPE